MLTALGLGKRGFFLVELWLTKKCSYRRTSINSRYVHLEETYLNDKIRISIGSLFGLPEIRIPYHTGNFPYYTLEVWPTCKIKKQTPP